MGASARRGSFITIPTGMFDCCQQLRRPLIRDCWLLENVSLVSVLYFRQR